MARSRKEDPDKFKVVRVHKKTGRRQVIQRNLTREQAMKKAMEFPTTRLSMVVFFNQRRS